MNKVIDYIVSLTHLYGLVHKDKVVEVFNRQNEEKIDLEIINVIMQQPKEELRKNFVEIHGDYFVADSILEFEDFETELKRRKGKPFYIPEQKELLKHKEESYFEETKEYKALLSYVIRNIFAGDEDKAEMLCENVQGVCQFAFSLDDAFGVLNQRNVNFKNEKQVTELMQLIMELANNTRIWENNGHTPAELSRKLAETIHVHAAVGRNIRSVVWGRDSWSGEVKVAI